MGIWAILMFALLLPALLLGYPVAFTLGAIAILFGTLTVGIEIFALLPHRIFGIMTNFTLLAVPLFIFMGIILDKSKVAEELLESLAKILGRRPGGLATAVILVGALLAASTGVVGATVVTLGVIALPTMLKHRYDASLACGTVAASGTLGQVIPPSIVAILLADIMGVPVGRMFMAAVIPGFFLIGAYILYIHYLSKRNPRLAPSLETLAPPDIAALLKAILPPVALIFTVLGSIFIGIASPTEAAAVGASGALLLAIMRNRLSITTLSEGAIQATKLTSMVFMILIGATAFGLVFKALGGDKLVAAFFSSMGVGATGFILISMAIIFILGFFLDFIEICFIVVPIFEPVARQLGLDPLWFAILIAMNLQTSFLTPPFGFSLFYLKAVAPKQIRASHIYKGVTPFILIQLVALILVAVFPKAVTWLPDLMDRYNGLL
jgi:tripartite ATP-independent transporter DctM subunit